MPEPLSNQSGAEQELPQYIECLLSVSGDAAFLNTFDKAFRSGCGPQWADRPPNTKPRYSFHALFPVPEEIQRRGFLKAGRLWCAGYWEAGGDLCEMQVKRVLGERRYRFFVWDTLPKNMFRVVSRHYPTLKFCLTALIKDDNSVLGGVPDAVGYDEPLHAMKFRTYEEAQAYIDTSSRSGQETAIVRRSLPPRILPGSAVELRLCSAAASRSRTACWRRRPAGFVSGDAKGGKTNESNTEKQDAHPDGGSPGTGGRA